MAEAQHFAASAAGSAKAPVLRALSKMLTLTLSLTLSLTLTLSLSLGLSHVRVNTGGAPYS